MEEEQRRTDRENCLLGKGNPVYDIRPAKSVFSPLTALVFPEELVTV
jgi:hypothetical protein